MPKKVTTSTRKKLTRQEQRDLDIEIGFMEGIVRRDPSYLEALQILGDDYTRRGRFCDGLKIDKELSSLKPADALVHYNLACSYSLTDNCAAALQALEQAINLGYRDFSWLSKDPDLKNVRKHQDYKKIRAKVASLSSVDLK